MYGVLPEQTVYKKLVNFENAIRCEQDDFNEKAILLKKETTYAFRNSHLRENLASARKLYKVPAHERIDRLMAEKFPRVDGTIQVKIKITYDHNLRRTKLLDLIF